MKTPTGHIPLPDLANSDSLHPEHYNNPWKTISSKDVYDNPGINVREDSVINPGGSNGIYGVVHFGSTVVGIIPVDHQCHTWLVGQYRYPLEQYLWEIPMGGDITDSISVLGFLRLHIGIQSGELVF